MYYKKAKLTLAQQKVYLEKNSKCGSVQIEAHTTLRWHGVLRPSVLSDEYKVEIIYKIGCSPEIWVKGDNLRNPNDKAVPHTYVRDWKRKRLRICVYLPGAGEWDPSMWIAGTLIPWTTEWLYFYEVWCATGEWLGGGVHPQAGKQKKA